MTRPFLILLLFTVALPCRAQRAGASVGERAAWAFVANVVRITADAFPGSDAVEEGYGFVVGLRRDGVAVIVTADHVVRKDDAEAGHVTLQFAHDQGRSRTATVLGSHLALNKGDLAVLEAPLPPGVELQWPAMVPSYDLQPGTSAWRIGKRGRWVPATAPGSFVGRAGAIELEFDDLDTPGGSSGGPILGERGLIGMVVRDGGMSGVPAWVLPIDTISAILRDWQLPWQIQPPLGAAPVAASPIAAAVVTPPPPLPALLPSAPVPQTPRVSLPVPALPPQPVPAPPPSRAAMEAMARRLVQGLMTAWSQDPAYAAPTIDAAYAPNVLRDGKVVHHAELVAEQRAFAEHWPMRRFAVRPGTVGSDCNLVVESCRVDAVVDWLRQSTAAGSQSGRSRFTFTVDFAGGRPFVMAQTEANGG